MDGTWVGRLSAGSCARVAQAAIGHVRRVPSLALALVDQGLVSGANFLIVVAVARGTEREEFGLFTLAFSVLLFLLSLVYALVNLPLSVLLPECDGPEVNAYLAQLERVHRAMVPILFVVALPFLLLFASWQLVLATALGTATRMGAEYHRRIAYSLHDTARALVIDLAGHGVTVAVAVAVLATGSQFHPWLAMTLVAVTGAFGWVVGLYVNRATLRGIAPERISSVARRHWAFGKWNLGATLASWSASQLYPFLVAHLIGLGPVALLNGSIRIMGVTNVLLQSMDTFTTPQLRRLAVAGDYARYRRFLLQVFTLGSLVVVALLGAVIIAPQRVLSWTLGPGYAHGAFALRMIALSVSFNFVARVAGLGLNALKESRPGFWGQVACAIATLLAGPWIIVHGGLEGACIALAANAAINAVILGCSFVRVARVRTRIEPMEVAA